MSKIDSFSGYFHLIINFGTHGLNIEEWKTKTGEYICHQCPKCGEKWGEKDMIRKHMPWVPHCSTCDTEDVIYRGTFIVDKYEKKTYFCEKCNKFTQFSFGVKNE